MLTPGSGRLCLLGLLCTGIVGCGGAKILKEPVALELEGPIAGARDDHVVAGLDWVIVKGGPGSWAKNAAWDEYLFRVRNLAAEEVSLDKVVVYDALLVAAEPEAERKKLVKASKRTARRFKQQGLKVSAGLGGGALVAAGGTATVAGLGAGAAAAAGAGSAMAVGALGLLLAGPVLAVGGVVRGVNNSQVSAAIEHRSTPMPLVLGPDDEVAVDLFFPLSPSPRKVEIHYSTAAGSGVLVIDTASVLEGLHLQDQSD